MKSTKYYRDFDLESLSITLKFQQYEYGDVNCVVWDAAIVLAKYLELLYIENKKIFSSKRVLELGSGLGCVGITAACFGGEVILTDLPNHLHQLQCNIEENAVHLQGRAKSIALKWGDRLEIDPFDVLLMADCIYYTEVIPDLIKTMVDSTTSQTVILICQELRDTEKQKTSWKLFVDKLMQYFTITYIPEKEQHPIFRSSDICIINAKKKCN
ncbi:protein N-lysine methyltransferase METTL21D-like [Daktulosphaira vitifoliae]|uniref:protein N-lysine methyltransferase METTL21D-like n=1 Tax=Daktulosphaira vitifoliae TaxID=58002 RepID=UPI0021AA341A|nr:protein N-lysine methyltransferase METTL21D-like [Daktulosphaira vitifoliae]